MVSTAMEGQQVPNVTVKILQGGSLVDLKTTDAFAGKRVVFFSLPGAFTPTCSASHLPRYEELFAQFQKAAGVDEVYCASVNDAFVMSAWAAQHEIKHVKMFPDGNGEFSKAMGLLVDKSGICFGERSWRYSMFIENNVVKKVFLEPEEGADPYGVSAADTILEYLAPGTPKPHRIAMLTKPGCPFCFKAKEMLKAKELAFFEIPLPESSRGIIVGAVTGASSVPQVFVDGKLVGGSEDLEKWLASRK